MTVPAPPSRVCIKNLPHSLTVDDFRTHFSQLSSITDAKLLPLRRIGYVGYKNPDDAQRAVKHFDRSFLGMARLAVEIAKPVGESSRKRRKLDDGSHSLRTASQIRTSTDDSVTSARGSDDRFSKEDPYPRIMHRAASRTWQNDGGLISSRLDADDVGGDPDLSPKLEIPESVPAITDDLAMRMGFGKTHDHSDASGSDSDISRTQTRTRLSPSNRATSPIDSSHTVVNDSNWLRSRTSRLLGLLDEDDEIREHVDKEKQPPKSLEPSQRTAVSPSSVLESTQSGGDMLDSRSLAADASYQASRTSTNAENGRLFIRNLAYTATEDDIRNFFQSYGELCEVHLPRDSRSGANKGFAHVTFNEPLFAQQALTTLDQTPFQGRLLHILPSSPKRQPSLDEYAFSKLPLKKQAQIRRKAEATTSSFQWNSLFMSADAVVASVADRLKVSKSDLLDPSSSDAALKQAHAETHVIQDTKAYFLSENIDLETFKSKEKGNEGILVKNFPHGTTIEELRQLFEAYAPVKRVLMPPSGTIAIIELDHPEGIGHAFANLAYRRFKNSVLFLERTPRGLFSNSNKDSSTSKISAKATGRDHVDDVSTKEPLDVTTLFVKNLNFLTTSQRLREACAGLHGFRSARVKTKPDPKRPGQSLSMGFGFVEFSTAEQAGAALSAMDRYVLDGHELVFRGSHRSLDAAEQQRHRVKSNKDNSHRCKIIIKNLPFEATKQDVRSLFGAYGKVRSVRLPRRLDSSTRGFAFADFVSSRDAENAAKALQDTHFLGRKLVLDFATEESLDPEKEIDQMQRKVSRQNDKVALQRLIAGSARKKFAVEGVDE